MVIILWTVLMIFMLIRHVHKKNAVFFTIGIL